MPFPRLASTSNKHTSSPKVSSRSPHAEDWKQLVAVPSAQRASASSRQVRDINGRWGKGRREERGGRCRVELASGMREESGWRASALREERETGDREGRTGRRNERLGKGLRRPAFGGGDVYRVFRHGPTCPCSLAGNRAQSAMVLVELLMFVPVCPSGRDLFSRI